MSAVALTLPGVDAGTWQIRHRFDKAAAALADRHYSRERVGSPQVGGPGFLLVLVTPCERACWISKRNAPEAFIGKRTRTNADRHRGYRCAMFRNEGAGLASELIEAAVALTEERWGPHAAGWLTYVRRDRIRSSNPGYCFKQAGWELDRAYKHPHFVRLRFGGEYR